MRFFYFSSMVIASFAFVFPSHAEKTADIKIIHSPATFAIKGQSLTLRAKVAGGSGGIDNVILYYALFRDAAPFRVSMASSGMDMYVGTIEAGLLSGLSSLSYYIEAQDKSGSLEETPWYDVQFRDPDAAPAAETKPAGASANNRPSPKSSSASDEGISGMTVGLIAGGAVALGAGAYLLADSGGDSDDGDGGGGGDPDGKAGTYSGSCTICEQVDPPVPCDPARQASVVIDEGGLVFSDSLLPGTAMSSRLSGNTFVLSASINNAEDSLSGNISFQGNVGTDGKIIGTISGNFDRAGQPGTYAGSFTLTLEP